MIFISLKTRISILFAVCLLSSASLSAITVQGNIGKSEESTVYFNMLFGRFHLSGDDVRIPVESDGSFICEISITEIRIGELRIGENKIFLFLKPSADTLYVRFNSSDKIDPLIFQGVLESQNRFINERPFPNYHERFNKLTSTERSDATYIDSLFDSEEKSEKTILAKIREKIGEESFHFLSEEIESYYLVLKFEAGLYVGQRIGLQQYVETWSARNDSLVNFIDCHSHSRYGPNYNHLIASWYAHLRMKFYNRSAKDSLFWRDQFGVASLSEMSAQLDIDKYNKIFYILCKNQMCDDAFEKALSNKIHRAQEDGDFENLKMIYDEFEKKFPNSSYLDKLSSGMERIFEHTGDLQGEVVGINFYDASLSFSSLDELIAREEYAGKIVVVDIWGTWCGPCREEFKYLPELKSRLKNMDVAFLYLAHEKVANPEAHWKETAKFFNLAGYNYLLNDAVLDDFWTKVDPNSSVMSYPTYMIIGRDGKVKIPSAMLPSEGSGLYEQIIKCLE